ncbi:MAG: DUF1284 domain-containing protein [Candidatus Woesearchaeota archaeon]
MVNKLRGHHLTHVYECYAQIGKLGALTEPSFTDKVIIVDTLDDLCVNCDGPREKCEKRYQLLDHQIARSFGIRMNSVYDASALKHIIEQKVIEYKGTPFWER